MPRTGRSRRSRRRPSPRGPTRSRTSSRARAFDLYSDWRSQVYYGVESEAAGAAQAVRETRGRRSSTTTASPPRRSTSRPAADARCSALDAFGSDLPYLVAVDDPWDEASPNHALGSQLADGRQAREAVRACRRGRRRDVVAGQRRASPRRSGSPPRRARRRTSRPSDVRQRLGFKSTCFRLGVLRLDRPAAAADGAVPPRPASRATSTSRGLEQRSSRTARGSRSSASRRAADGTLRGQA